MSKRLLLTASIAVIHSAYLCSALAEDPASMASGEVKPVQNANQIYTTPDYRGDLTERSTLIGDLGGARQQAANSGVTLDGGLTQVTQGVVSGGIDTGWEYMGRGDLTLNLDTAKMDLWPGGLLTVMGEGNFGDPLTAKTGSLLGTNANDLFPEVDDSFVLPNVTYTQFLSPQFGIAFGKFATISETSGDMNEFAHGTGKHGFLNPLLNFDPVLALTVPYSTLGILGIWLPTKELAITVGAVDSHGVPNKAGLDELWEDGATFISEARYTTNLSNKLGHQLIGGSYSTSNYVDLDTRTASLIFPGIPSQEADNSWSVYWNMDQYFYQPDPAVNRGVGIFARLGLSDGEANPIEDFASIGIGGKGMFANRLNDSCGFGYFHASSAESRITDQFGFEDAQGFEAYYNIAITPAIELTPDIQWIQPSQKRVDESWLTGVRLHTAF